MNMAWYENKNTVNAYIFSSTTTAAASATTTTVSNICNIISTATILQLNKGFPNFSKRGQHQLLHSRRGGPSTLSRSKQKRMKTDMLLLTIQLQ